MSMKVTLNNNNIANNDINESTNVFGGFNIVVETIDEYVDPSLQGK